jgi:hypothetical protein
MSYLSRATCSDQNFTALIFVLDLVVELGRHSV